MLLTFENVVVIWELASKFPISLLTNKKRKNKDLVARIIGFTVCVCSIIHLLIFFHFETNNSGLLLIIFNDFMTVCVCQVHKLEGKELRDREVIHIDIANDKVATKVSNKLNRLTGKSILTATKIKTS